MHGRDYDWRGFFTDEVGRVLMMVDAALPVEIWGVLSRWGRDGVLDDYRVWAGDQSGREPLP